MAATGRPSGNGNHACPLKVMYPRSKLTRTVGESLTLNCTVKFCADQAEEPVVHWCVLQGHSCQPIPANNTSSNNDDESSLLVRYTIANVNYSDSGTFRCEASHGNIKSMGHSIILNVTEASDDPIIPVEHVDNSYKWYFLLLLPLVVVIVCVTLYCREKRRSAQKRQRAQEKNITAASSSPDVTMVNTELASMTDTTEIGPVEPRVNKRRMEPFYVNEPFPIIERCEESIYVNDLLNQY
ncbi:B- and T-lymphocyte attenuator-like isoform X2 [Scyliorhinus canicula]|uniref:B- and T-lymphocyte attenuator-like isoform X2 n=1 Tax=Scyliorhinus canicula TaxID=7830 RepID=UPI0018F57E3E|nr:B- and T-lymphocyte attenuator-like isoform X2 [Scyliorhinus canicula]